MRLIQNIFIDRSDAISQCNVGVLGIEIIDLDYVLKLATNFLARSNTVETVESDRKVFLSLFLLLFRSDYILSNITS